MQKYQFHFWVHFNHFILYLLQRSTIFPCQIFTPMGCNTCQIVSFQLRLIQARSYLCEQITHSVSALLLPNLKLFLCPMNKDD